MRETGDSGTFDTYPVSHRKKPGFKSRFYFTLRYVIAIFGNCSHSVPTFSALVVGEDRKDLEEKLKASAS